MMSFRLSSSVIRKSSLRLVQIFSLVYLLLQAGVTLASSLPKEVVVADTPEGGLQGVPDESGAQIERRVLRVATGEWSPYVSKAFPHHGALAHVISLIFDKAGIDVEYAYFPWPRGYQMVLDGVWHATMPYYCSPEREVDFYCSEPIVNGQQVFFYHIDKPLVWDKFEDLKGLNIGATLGYYYGAQFEEYEKNQWINVQRIARDDSNFKVLMRGRIHAFPQDMAVGYSMIREIFTENEQKKITHHPKPIHTKPLHLIFPKKHPESKEFLTIFNAGVKRMRADGSLQRYMDAMRDGKYEKGKNPSSLD